MTVITGGGTGGHLASAKAVAEALGDMGEELIFIGSQSGQDRAWFENSELFKATYFLPSCGVVNRRGIAKIWALMRILAGAFRCFLIFRRHLVKRVVSVGGYSAAPASLAAVASKRRLFICEQNAVIGRLNALLRGFAVELFSSYENGKISKKPYAYPVQSRFFSVARGREKLENILFLGGSQGARFINDLAILVATELDKRGVKIAHQCGKNDFDKLRAKYDEMGICADLFIFDKKIEKRLQTADLAISRSGAGSLWELCAARVPAIFIPFKYAAGDHQYFNAKFLEKLNLAKLFRQEDLGGDEPSVSGAQIIINTAFEMDLKAISDGLREIINKDGAKQIASSILQN